MTRHTIKNKYFLGTLFFLTIIFFAQSAQASTYYIDYENGNDANTGTATSSPWKHSPGDPNASVNAAIILAAGDTIVFKGGVTYEFSAVTNPDYIEVNASGSAGNVITYRSGHLHTPVYGTGRAVIDGANANIDASVHRAVLFLKNHQYITVEGLEIKNQLTYTGDYAGLIGWSGNSVEANIIVDDCLLYNSTAWGLFVQGGNSSNLPSDFIFTNNTIHDTYNHCLSLRYAIDNVLIEDNDISECGSFDPESVGNPRGNSIGLLGFENHNDMLNIVIRRNDLGGQTTSPTNKGHILLQNDTNGLIIEDNYFYGIVSSGSIAIAGRTDNIIIRNNVWNVINEQNEGLIRYRTDHGSGYGANNIQIVNNTFIGVHTNRTEAILYFHAGNNTDSAPLFTNVDIRNNIIDSQDDANDTIFYIGQSVDSAPVVQLSTFTIDYNAYQSLKTNGLVFYAQDTLKNFTDWKSWLSIGGANGSDSHSIFGQVDFVNEVGGDFKLNSADTIALDNGVDLSSTGYSDDRDGVTRPQGSAWDIGAYEYQSATVIRGDVDNNSVVNTTDALLTLRNSLGLSMTSTAWQASATTGDVDCNGISNSTDALLILRYSLGLGMGSTAWCES